MMRSARHLAVSLGLVLAFCIVRPAYGEEVMAGSGTAEKTAATSADIPAEQKRLDTSTFRRGLKDRGLTELLELHLSDYPPKSLTARLRFHRELKLARYADLALPVDERLAALAEANRLLEQLFDASDDLMERLEWGIALARSLIYEEGEPYFSSILYRGGNSQDRRRLRQVTTRALRALDELRQQLVGEYERIDTMRVREFEALERSGYIEKVDKLAPQIDYLFLWTLFYDALSRSDADPARGEQLHRILELISQSPGLLEIPHDESHVQLQGLLLTGMTYRLLNNHRAAREHFDRALLIADRLADPHEFADVHWAISLTHVERIRNEIEDCRFDQALELLQAFRLWISEDRDQDFGLRLVAALLERSVYRTQANRARSFHNVDDAERYRTLSWKPLADLAVHDVARRDHIYAMLYDMMEADVDPAALDPFEQCALIAGLLFDASRTGEQRSPDAESTDELLDRAVAVGELFLEGNSRARAILVPEVLFNVGVAHYRRGRSVEAAVKFLSVGRDHRDFEKALSGATLAAQICAKLHARPEFAQNRQLSDLYLETLAVVVTQYPKTQEARYWRFFYAQLLDELYQFDAAAAQYVLVDAEHERYIESVFLRVRCLARALQRRAGDDPDDRLDLRRRTNEFTTAQREFIALASSGSAAESNQERTAQLRSLSARAMLILAEVQVLPHVGRTAKALETLEEFEAEFPDETELVGRVLRARLVAYEKLGRLEEAARAIPAYIAADPDGAGPTLQSLYRAMVADIDRFEEAGRPDQAQSKARAALLLAKQITDWSKSADDPAINDRLLALQLAEANLRAGFFEQARALFAAHLGVDDKPLDLDAIGDHRALLGYAESLYKLGKYVPALPLFNHLAVSLPVGDTLHFRMLLRDLQCRTALNHPPEDVIKVIEQKQYLHPDMGGPELKKAFQELLRENRKRASE